MRGGAIRDVYMCWDWNGVTDPERHPEAVVLQQVMDRYRPEAYVDVHGFSHEQMMWESTGITWAAVRRRSFVPEVPLMMNAAAEEAGFSITMGEQRGEAAGNDNCRGPTSIFMLAAEASTSPATSTTSITRWR